MLSLEAPGGTGLEVFDYFRAIQGGEVSGFLADGESFNITQYDIYARKMQKYVRSHRETYVPGNLVIHRGDRHHRPLPPQPLEGLRIHLQGHAVLVEGTWYLFS